MNLRGEKKSETKPSKRKLRDLIELADARPQKKTPLRQFLDNQISRPNKSGRKSERWTQIPGAPGAKYKSPTEMEMARQLDFEEITYEHDNEKTKVIDGRKFRFDFTIEASRKICLEVQGGVGTQNYNASGHTSGAGFSRDCEKSFLAQLQGWLVIAVTPNQVFNGTAIDWVKRALS